MFKQVQADFDEKPTHDDIQVDTHRFNKFLGRVEPLVLNYLDENIERPNFLRMLHLFYRILLSLVDFRTH